MKNLFRPTLVKRMLGALFLVFFVVWSALTAYSYLLKANDPQFAESGHGLGQYIAEAIDPLDDDAQAKALVSGVVGIQNKIFVANKVPIMLMAQLWDKDGTLVYADAYSQKHPLQGEPGRTTKAVLDGRTFYVYRAELKHWNLVVATPDINTGWALTAIALDLLPYLVIAFALIYLALLVAINHGLRPLKDLAAHIASRNPDDLSATGIKTPYAELQPLQQALDGMLAKLRKKVDQETAFVQEAAHELRTPMAVVSAQAHVLRLAPDAEARQEAEQHLDAALARASHLVGQLLQLAHIGGERAVVVVPLDLAQTVRNELAALVPGARKRGIELGMDAPDSLMVHTERHTFTTILHNLVGNAIRYVHEGGTVDVCVSREGDRIRLSVTDNGPGIAADQRELVFERFHRGADHAAPGAGLGLAIVRQACQRLGGSVFLKPGINGRGCQFVVDLPAG